MKTQNARIESHERGLVLQFPLCIDIRDLDAPQVGQLIESAKGSLGAFSMVDVPRLMSAKQERPYLHIRYLPPDWLGVFSCDRPGTSDTLYTPEAFLRLSSNFSPEQVGDSLFAQRPRPEPRRRPYEDDWEVVREDGLQYSQKLRLYWYKGKDYDELSASHNGIIGMGYDLPAIIRSEERRRDEPADEGPSP